MDSNQINQALNILQEYKPLEVAALRGSACTMNMSIVSPENNDKEEDIDPSKEVIRCIDLYIALTGRKKLTERQLKVLAYYLLYGYSKNIKKQIRKTLKMKEGNLNNMNCILRKKGLIIADKRNEHANTVVEDLRKIKEYLIDGEGEFVLVKVNR